MEAALTVRDLHVSYGANTALRDVNVTVQKGGITGLIGVNGSGKSTLFNAITGRLKPDRGSVEILGLTPTRARAQGLVSYMPQHEGVDWGFPVSVRDVVMMGRYGKLGFTRRPRRADREAVDRAIEMVGLTELAGRQIGQISGGQKKRAFVARGIAQDAQVMLLDEPFAGIDKASEHTIVQLLRELAAEGRTIVVSTHDLATLPQLADRAVLLLQTVLAQGPLDSVLKPEQLVRAFGMDVLAEGGNE